MAKRPELMVMSGDLSGKRFAVPEAGLRLGRSSSNDIHVPDEELSRNHCMFEPDGEDGVRVVDLASANGTFVNGEQLESEPRRLAVGDVVEVGSTTVKVVGDGPAPVRPHKTPGGAVDLGLGSSAPVPAQGGVPAAANGAKPAVKRSPLANVLWAVVAIAIAAAAAIVLLFPSGGDKSGASLPVTVEAEKAPAFVSLSYEKVEADSSRIFRYQMTIDESGTLHVLYDDVPGEDRHVDKSAKLSPRAAQRIVEIFDTKGWDELEDVYAGPSASSENALKSWRIRTVRGTKVREVLVENVLEPEAFQAVREALETFSQNELGIWAIQYSREKLISLSADSEKVGDAKWEEREVEYGNLSACVKSYKVAVFYLDTVNPKPDGYAGLKDKLSTAEAELDHRYREQRFLADKAINLADWDTARDELKILCEIVPEKDDERYAEARAKLVDVENRIKKAKKGGSK